MFMNKNQRFYRIKSLKICKKLKTCVLKTIQSFHCDHTARDVRVGAARQAQRLTIATSKVIDIFGSFELDTKQFVINFVWTNKHFNVFKDIIGFTRVSFNCATHFITIALFL